MPRSRTRFRTRNDECQPRSLISVCCSDVFELFSDFCGVLCCRSSVFLKVLALALCLTATCIMNGQFYLYFNRAGDVFTMIALGGGLLSSFVLTLTYLFKCPSVEGEKLLLLVYGVLNSVIGILLLLENLYYAMSKAYLLLALFTKASGIVMLIDFARSQHYEDRGTQPSRSAMKR